MNEHQYEALLEQFREEFPAWVTKDGRFFRYEHMSDRHLNNTINFLRRQGWAVMAEAEFIDPTDSSMEKVRKAATIVHPQLELLCAERARRMEAGLNISDEEAIYLSREYARTRSAEARRKALDLIRQRKPERLDPRDYDDDDIFYRGDIPF